LAKFLVHNLTQQGVIWVFKNHSDFCFFSYFYYIANARFQLQERPSVSHYIILKCAPPTGQIQLEPGFGKFWVHPHTYVPLTSNRKFWWSSIFKGTNFCPLPRKSKI